MAAKKGEAVVSSAPVITFVVEPDDDMKCLICFDVARDPLQHEACGKLYCRACLKKYGRNQPCPNCREGQSHYYVDNRSRRAIEALKVKCCNATKCKWEGTLSSLDEHMATCQFTLVPCPNECKDKHQQTSLLMRKHIDDHLRNDCPLRDYECQLCGEKGTYIDITKVHSLVCEKAMVFCDNSGCVLRMERCKVKEHIDSECEYTVLPCKYKSVGCDTMVKRHRMADHEQKFKQFHLDLAMEAATALKQTVSKLVKSKEMLEGRITVLVSGMKGTIAHLQMEKEELKAKNELTAKSPHFVTAFSITNFLKKKTNNVEFVTQPFYTGEKGYYLALKVLVNGASSVVDAMSVYVVVKPGRYDKELPWPFVGDVTVTILNQLEDKQHYSRVITYDEDDHMRPGSSLGYRSFIAHSKLHKRQNVHYLMGDSLHFRVYYKPPS